MSEARFSQPLPGAPVPPAPEEVVANYEAQRAKAARKK